MPNELRMNDPTPPRTWRSAVGGNVLMIGLVSFFTDFSSEMIYPLLPALLAGLAPPGSAAIWVGITEGIAETTASLVKLVSGRLSDALGKRKALVLVGYGLSASCRPLMAAAHAAWQVVSLRFLDRVGKGIRTAPRDAIISDSVHVVHRGLAFSFHRAMDHAGAVLGPLVAGVLLYLLLGKGIWARAPQDASSETVRALRWLFASALVPGLAAVAVLAFGVREIPPPPVSPQNGGRVGRGAWCNLPWSFFSFVAVVTIFALGNSSDLFLLLHGQMRFGIGVGAALALWIALHLSKIVFSFAGGILSDRLGRRGVIAAGWLGYALVYLGMARAGSAAAFVALFVAYGFYYGMTEGVEKALVADLVPAHLRATAYGIYHGAIGIAALPASLVFGVVWKRLGPAPAFGLGASLAGLAAALLLVVPRQAQRPPGSAARSEFRP